MRSIHHEHQYTGNKAATLYQDIIIIHKPTAPHPITAGGVFLAQSPSLALDVQIPILVMNDGHIC